MDDQDVAVSTEEMLIRSAEAELEKVRAIQNDAREALNACEIEVRKWERVIAALRPPEPKQQKRAAALDLPKERTVSDSRLDAVVAVLREHFQPGEQFLTKDAAHAAGINPSYMIKLLQELRMRGDLRLAGRAPGKGVIPLFALIPVRSDEPGDPTPEA